MGDALLGKWCGSGVLLYDAFYHLACVHCKYLLPDYDNVLKIQKTFKNNITPST